MPKTTEEIRQESDLDSLIAKVRRSIPQQSQTQVPLKDQLVALYGIANRLGLYDAADSIQKRLWPPKF